MFGPGFLYLMINTNKSRDPGQNVLIKFAKRIHWYKTYRVYGNVLVPGEKNKYLSPT